jgi:hypothetical protein
MKMREGQKTAIVIIFAALLATACLVLAAYKIKDQMEDFYFEEIQYLMSIGTMIFFSLGMGFAIEQWVKR